MSRLTGLNKWIALLILATLPVQQLWIRPLTNIGAPDWLTLVLTNWAAPVIFFLAIVGLWRSRPRITTDYWLMGLCVVAVLPALWQFSLIGDLAVGWRYIIIATLGYWVGRGQFLTEGLVDRCMRVTMWVVLFGVVMQICSWWLAAPGLVAKLGLEPLFAAGDWWRVYGPMSGPNQLGTFLALAGVWLYWRKQLTRTELLLVCIGVVLTFSRSALLGMATGLLVTAVLFAPTWRRRIQLTAGIAVAVICVALAINNTASLREGLVEARRADLRMSLLQDTAERFQNSGPMELLIGHGAGTAGPAAAVLQNGGFIPENWFLQIAYEFGLAGLVLLLGFLGTAITYGIQTRKPALVGIILLLVVNSLFLHPLSDNFAAALWFYFMLGAAITPSKPEENKVQ